MGGVVRSAGVAPGFAPDLAAGLARAGAVGPAFDAPLSPLAPPRARLPRTVPVARQMMGAYGDKAIALLDGWVVEHVGSGDRDGAAFWAQVLLVVRTLGGGVGRV